MRWRRNVVCALFIVGTMARLLPAQAPSAEDRSGGFESLCDGQSLAGWTGAVDGYTVEDGAITCIATKGGGNLFTEKEYADFVLRFEFRMEAGGNNGIGLRVPMGGHAAYDGMEIQVLDNTAERYKKLQPYQYHGSVYGVIPAKRGYLKAVGAWNLMEIRCVGRDVTVVLNGETIVDGNLDEASSGGTMDGKDHPGLARTSGHLVLCGHGSRVQFRGLRVKAIVSGATAGIETKAE